MPLDLTYKTGNFSLPFQRAILATYLTNASALRRYRSIIDPRFFEKPADQAVCDAMLTVYDSAKALPSRVSVIHAMRKQVREKALLADATDALNSYYKRKITDSEFILSQAIEFARTQSLANAAITTVHDVAKGKTQGVVKRFQEALRVGEDMTDMGLNYLKRLPRRLRLRKKGKLYRPGIPTGFLHLDYVLRGGCRKGWLVFFLATAKKGKSIALLNVALGSTSAGFRTLYITLELSSNEKDDDIGDRVDLRVAGPKNTELAYSDPDAFAKIVTGRAPVFMQGDLITKEYAGHTLTASKIRTLLEALEANGEKVDTVVVDHADLMIAEDIPRNAGRPEREGQVYLELKQLAQEMDVLVYTASQANKGANQKETTEASDASWAYEKIGHCDLAISINQTRDEAKESRGRLSIVAARRHAGDIHIDVEVKKEAYYMHSVGLLDAFGQSIPTPHDSEKRGLRSRKMRLAGTLKKSINEEHHKAKKKKRRF